MFDLQELQKNILYALSKNKIYETNTKCNFETFIVMLKGIKLIKLEFCYYEKCHLLSENSSVFGIF